MPFSFRHSNSKQSSELFQGLNEEANPELTYQEAMQNSDDGTLIDFERQILDKVTNCNATVNTHNSRFIYYLR